MPDTSLLVNLALALAAATIGGAVAVRLGQSAIVGYVLVGILIGPYTPGPVGESETVAALADIGIIFLLFALGLQLSLRDMLKVGRVATVGGSLQVVAMLAIGFAVGQLLGFGELESLFLGAVISNSSSTVLAKVLGERGEEEREHARLAFAWSTVQDLSTVVLVVVLTALAGGGDPGADLGWSVLRALLFIAVVLPLGVKVLPWVFERAALLRSREVFVLSVVAIALGTAYLSQLAGLSLALGAFLAGILVSESDVSYQALGELTPVRDIFAGLFFVSVGMLLDPLFLLTSAPLIAIAFLLIVPVKGILSALIARLMGIPTRVAVLAGAALAQSAEFSFLLARLGVDMGVVSQEMFGLMLSGAAASVIAAGWVQRGAPAGLRWFAARVDQSEPTAEPIPADLPNRRFAVICGYGAVGRTLARSLSARGFSYVVVHDDPRVVSEVQARGGSVVLGSPDSSRNLDRAQLGRAQVLVVVVSDSISLRQIVSYARRHYPRLPIVARTRSSADREYLLERGVQEVVVPETEAALELARFTLTRFGVSAAETGRIVAGLRRQAE